MRTITTEKALQILNKNESGRVYTPQEADAIVKYYEGLIELIPEPPYKKHLRVKNQSPNAKGSD